MLTVLCVCFVWPIGLEANDEKAARAYALLAFAMHCPSNDDEAVYELIDSHLDSIGSDGPRAQEAAELTASELPDADAQVIALACATVERAVRLGSRAFD
ncbi:MAG: hypothetical protein KI785_05420 [Devosiaceae bacterium]|nr:hypothetical protein [Devosiaceae bacterium MH13]